MTSFLIDIKDENDRLIEKLLKTSNSIPQKEEHHFNPINQDQKLVMLKYKNLINKLMNMNFLITY